MANTEKSFPWDDVSGDRTYNADNYAEYFSILFAPGIVASANLGNGLQIKESASLGMRIKFGSGAAWSTFGRGYIHTQDEELDVPVASSLQDRTDSISIQFNKSTRSANMVYKQGDESVTRTDTIYELQIAKIKVGKNATQITNADITDMRSNDTVCGYCTPYGDAKVGDLTAQFNAQFESWFNNIKRQLSDDAAGSLQLQINTTNDNIAGLQTQIKSTNDALTTKASDSNVVHLTGNESLSGTKTFLNLIIGSISGAAAKWANARKFLVNLASTTSVNVDGSADVTNIGVSGILPVNNGGTGANTLTGLVKGNGTDAMTAAVAGTDYVGVGTPVTDASGNSATFNGGSIQMNGSDGNYIKLTADGIEQNGYLVSRITHNVTVSIGTPSLTSQVTTAAVATAFSNILRVAFPSSVSMNGGNAVVLPNNVFPASNFYKNNNIYGIATLHLNSNGTKNMPIADIIVGTSTTTIALNTISSDPVFRMDFTFF